MNFISYLIRLPIHGYRLFISPVLPGVCRHAPSCSEYALDAIRLHGAFKGVGLAARRIARCQPWGTSGYDPVPEPNCRCDAASDQISESGV